MFKKWRERKELQRQWEEVVVFLTNSQILVISQAARLLFISVFSQTLLFYIHNNRLNKQTLKILNVIKRILADKRQFDTIKCIDYLLVGHSVSQYKINKKIRERIMAHFWAMANSYLQMIQRSQQSNPFAPGETLKKLEESNG